MKISKFDDLTEKIAEFIDIISVGIEIDIPFRELPKEEQRYITRKIHKEWIKDGLLQVKIKL